MTYREYDRRGDQYARWAMAHGITKGDVVALMMPNRPEFLAVWLGITRAGGKVLKQYQDAYNGIKVRVTLAQATKLAALPGVIAVRSIPKVKRTLTEAVPFTGTPAAWNDFGVTGAGVKIAIMGCIVNGPGESKHANIGISLPGTGEAPAAPVFVDGVKTVTLRGPRIAEDFKALVNDYIEKRYGAGRQAAE